MKNRIFAGLLAALMLLSMLASCGETETAGSAADSSADLQTNNDTISDGTDTTAPEETEKTAPELSGLTYDGSKFTILVSNSGIGKMNDFSAKNEDHYTRVASANYKKITKIEQLYDIDIEDVQEFGAANGNGVGYNKITQDFASGLTSYHTCMVGTYDAAQLALEGYLYDLNSLDYVDLSCKWWDQDANKDLSIYGKMFYTTGDISTVDNLATHIILFNKKIAAENNITDLYTSVTEGKWTYDKFLSYVKLVSADADGNDTMNELDTYGLLTWNDVLQASLSGSRVRIAQTNVDGEIEMSLYSEKSADLIDRLTEAFNDGNTVYNYTTRNTTQTQPSATYDRERDNMFNEDRALFYATVCNTIPRHRDSQTLDFGILPYPKYDEAQETYGSYVGASYSGMICVEATIEDKAYVGTVLESLAYEGMSETTPVYYDYLLKGQFIRDEESSEMLDIIFNQRCFDLGIYYKIPSESPYTSNLTQMIARRETGTFASRYDAALTAAKNEIRKLNDEIYRFS